LALATTIIALSKQAAQPAANNCSGFVYPFSCPPNSTGTDTFKSNTPSFVFT